MKYVKSLFIGLSLLLSIGINALNLPSHPQNYVSDYGHMLSDKTIQQLDDSLRQFEEKTSNQIAVVTVDSLDGDTIEDATTQLEDKWKIGQKDKNNGVILLIAKKDHKVRIEVGYGLEEKLTDTISGEIIRNEITPNFRQGNYDRGVQQAVSAITQTIQHGYHPNKKLSSDDDNNPLTLIFVFVVLYVFLRIIISSFFGRNSGGGSSRGGFSGSSSGGGGFSGGGGSSGGGGASSGW